MPFLGKDWRSSGEQWIRTEHGWERTRVLECILDNLHIGLSKTGGGGGAGLSSGLKKKKRKAATDNKRLNSLNDDDDDYDVEDMDDDDDEDDDDLADEEEAWNYLYDELSLLSDELSAADSACGEYQRRRRSASSSSSTTSSSVRRRQPHIIYWEVEAANRENNAPKATISEVLNALDMPGAVKDIKRFNYVCRLVQIIINEKLNQLSGNAQRTLFMIVKHMLIQVIKTQENLNVMRKLLHDFKKKIQDSIYFHFYYIGSQKLCDRHLATIAKWQEILENPSQHKKLKRLHSSPPSSSIDDSSSYDSSSTGNGGGGGGEEKENNKPSLDNIPIDCKLEIMRRLNSGLDLVNLSKCNRNMNDLVSNELKIWKNLCQFHFQQASINSFVSRLQHHNKDVSPPSSSESPTFIHVNNSPEMNKCTTIHDDLDWKLIYFRLKRRYGHREIYADMVHKCYHCKSLFWKEIGHPCVIREGLTYPDSLEIRSEPITPKKLIELLLR